MKWEDPGASQSLFPLVRKKTAHTASVFNKRRKIPSDKSTSRRHHTRTHGHFIFKYIRHLTPRVFCSHWFLWCRRSFFFRNHQFIKMYIRIYVIYIYIYIYITQSDLHWCLAFQRKALRQTLRLGFPSALSDSDTYRWEVFFSFLFFFVNSSSFLWNMVIPSREYLCGS